MKFVIRYLFVLTVSSAFAESPFLRELAQLTAQRDQALSAAAEPINRRYKEGLEALGRRATQANDLDAAIKIREAMGQIPAAQSPMAPPLAPATTPVPGKVLITKHALEKALEGTNWKTDSNSWLQNFSFNKKGQIIINKGRSVPIKALDGATVTYPWDAGTTTTISFAPDLSSAAIGTVNYRRE